MGLSYEEKSHRYLYATSNSRRFNLSYNGEIRVKGDSKSLLQTSEFSLLFKIVQRTDICTQNYDRQFSNRYHGVFAFKTCCMPLLKQNIIKQSGSYQ